jgi:hypothetical protein
MSAPKVNPTLRKSPVTEEHGFSYQKGRYQLPMAQLPNRGGGNTQSSAAKAASVQREEQIVALRLRHVSFAAIGRQLGISPVAAFKAFHKALRANTKTDIQTVHRTELADLDLL